MLFGDPIYLPEDLDDEKTEMVRKKVEDSLNELYVDIKQNYYKYLKGE